MCPEFQRVFVLNECKFPDNALLVIKLMQKLPKTLLGGHQPDEVVGETLIDLEDRWFHPIFRKMTAAQSKTDSVPIESRELRDEASLLSRGTVTLWTEIVPNSIAMVML